MKKRSFASNGTENVSRDLSDGELCAVFPHNFASMYAFIAEHSDLVHFRENDAGWRWCISDQIWSFYNTVLNLDADLFSRDLDACVGRMVMGPRVPPYCLFLYMNWSSLARFLL